MTELTPSILRAFGLALDVPVRQLEQVPAAVQAVAVPEVGPDPGAVRAFAVAGGRYLGCRYHHWPAAILVLGPYRRPEDPQTASILLDAASEARAGQALQTLASTLGQLLDEERQQRELTTHLELVSHAALAITGELALETVLHRIVDLAREVAEARYAALGVPDGQGQLAAFLTAGMTTEQEARIGERPRGYGILGLLLSEPKTLRLADLHAHPASVGFPPHHPPMTSFLGVPIMTRGQVLGNLYLTDKQTGAEFTEEDARVVELLARHAAVAIENARLYQQLELHERRLQLLLEQLPEAVVVVEPNPERVSLVNQQASQLLGWPIAPPLPLGSFLARNARYTLEGLPLPEASYPLIRALRQGEVVLHEEVCLARPDGKRITKLVNAAPVHDERGSIVAAIAVFQDITAIKDAEQLKDDFLSLVSHELRTPLTTIHGGAHLLLYDQEQLDAETQQMLLADLFGESRRLATLIENMVQLGQIRAGRFQLETEPVHVAKLVEGAIRAVQEAAPDRRFAVEVEPDLLAAGDPGRLEQVLRNLLTNAVKYSPPGSLIEVGATAADDEVMIAVRDQGAGIAEEDLGRIFERFERGAQGRSGTASGMGLGLYLAKQIVEAQGGRIWVEQPVDGGTRVRLTMPSLSEET